MSAQVLPAEHRPSVQQHHCTVALRRIRLGSRRGHHDPRAFGNVVNNAFSRGSDDWEWTENTAKLLCRTFTADHDWPNLGGTAAMATVVDVDTTTPPTGRWCRVVRVIGRWNPQWTVTPATARRRATGATRQCRHISLARYLDKDRKLFAQRGLCPSKSDGRKASPTDVIRVFGSVRRGNHLRHGLSQGVSSRDQIVRPT